MADIQTGRWGRLAQVAFNLKQRMTLGQVMPDVLPVFDLEHRAPDFDIHAGVDHGMIYGAQAGVAAQTAWLIFRNPTGSGKIHTVDELAVSCPALSTVYLNMGGAGSNLATVPMFCDYRRAQQGRPVADVQGLNSAASVAAIAMASYYAPANVTLTVKGPWIITPGGTLLVENSTLNTAMAVTFRFRERIMQPGEDTFI